MRFPGARTLPALFGKFRLPHLRAGVSLPSAALTSAPDPIYTDVFQASHWLLIMKMPSIPFPYTRLHLGLLLPLLVASLGLGACATANFYPHEGPDESQSAPRGGSHFVAEGIDVWFIGEPDRPYRILGYIESPAGALVDDQHRSVDSTVLKKAREIGATALIEVVTQSQADPFARGTFGDRHWGFGMDWPVNTRQVARYTAIQYRTPAAR